MLALLGGCDLFGTTATTTTDRRAPEPRPPTVAFDPGPPSDPEVSGEVPFVGEQGFDSLGRPLQHPDATMLTAMLRARRFDDLDAAMLAYQEAFEDDPRKESWPKAAIQAFEIGVPEFGPLLDAWVLAKPESFGARAARGAWHTGMGWATLGIDLYGTNSDERLDAVEREYRAGLPDLDTAIALRPRLLAAIDTKLDTQGLLGRPVAQRRATYEQGLAVCPTCWTIRESWVLGLAPERGGSYEEMRAAAKSAEPHIEANPALALLPSLIVSSLCASLQRDYGPEATLSTCARAIEGGVEPRASCGYGEVLAQAGRLSDALPQFAAGLRVDPQWRSCLVGRQAVLQKKGRVEEAANDLLIARRLAPHNRDIELDIESVLRSLQRDAREANAGGDGAKEKRLLDLTHALSPKAGGDKPPA